MSRLSWVLLILLVILGVSQMWNMEKKGSPSWTKCKESLLIQTISGSCTLRDSEKNSKNPNLQTLLND